MEHLGGHGGTTHIDVGTLLWLKEDFRIKSMLDVGCSTGTMVELAKQLGIESIGVDGDPWITEPGNFHSDSRRFILHDYSQGPLQLEKFFDLAWSVEFIEHVEEKFMPNYMGSFEKAKYVIVTFAPPGWPGWHHVNCKPLDYWVKKFKEYGFSFSNEKTAKLREKSTMNIGNKPFFHARTNQNLSREFVKERGLFFINNRFFNGL